MTGIYEALSAVMGDVQGIAKGQRVTEGPARFNFRGVDDVVNAVGPVLRKHSVVVVPHDVIKVEHERYATKSGAQMDGVTIVIRWRFYAADGSYIEASSAGQSSDAGDKAIPKAHSVAYRTVLLQALCIPTDEPDPDTYIHERSEPERRPAPKDPLDVVRDVAAAAGYDENEFETWVDVEFPGVAVTALDTEQLGVAYARFQALWKQKQLNAEQGALL